MEPIKSSRGWAAADPGTLMPHTELASGQGAGCWRKELQEVKGKIPLQVLFPWGNRKLLKFSLQ